MKVGDENENYIPMDDSICQRRDPRQKMTARQKRKNSRYKSSSLPTNMSLSNSIRVNSFWFTLQVAKNPQSTPFLKVEICQIVIEDAEKKKGNSCQTLKKKKKREERARDV